MTRALFLGLALGLAGCAALPGREPIGLTLQPAEITALLGAVPPEGIIYRELNPQGFPEYTYELDGTLMVGIPGTDRFGPFLIDKYEVTNSLYAEFCSATGRILPRAPQDPAWRHYYFLPNPNHPVDHVAWIDAHDYARWRGKSLPTAEEWSHVALGLGAPLWQDGPGELAVANLLEVGRGQPDAIGSYPADLSAAGVADMAGNVDEWVLDTSFGLNRRLMGGSWNTRRRDLPQFLGVGTSDDARTPAHGFRTIFRLRPLAATGN